MRDRTASATRDLVRTSVDSTQALLIEAGRPIGSDGLLCRILERSAEVDWGRFLRVGALHRILPSAYFRLRSLEALEQVPAEVAAALEDAYVRSADRSALYFREIAALANAAEGTGVRFALINGELLAARHYPDPALRPFGDCDLLVARGDERKLDLVLGELGLVQGFGESHGIRLPTRSERRFARVFMKHAIAYIRRDGDGYVVVEPHHTLFWRDSTGRPAFDVSMGDLLERSVRIDLPGAWSVPPRVFGLAPLDLALYVCVDVYEDAHRIEKVRRREDLQLLRFVDLWMLVSGAIDLYLLVEAARTHKMEEPVYFCLHSLHQLYGCVPEDALNAVRPEDPAGLDEVGFPEELVPGAAPVHYDRPLLDRLFDAEYRLSALEAQSSRIRETTFQMLKRQGDAI